MNLNRDILRKLPLALRIEIEENAQRKPLTQSELAAEQKRFLDQLRKHKAPGTRTDLKGGKATSEEPFSEVRATALIGKLFNESHKQVEKRFAIIDAAKAEPEKFGYLVEDIDRSGKVNGPYRRLKNAQQAEQLRAAPPPLPDGQHHVGQVDSPWAYEPDDEDAPNRGVLPYAPRRSSAAGNGGRRMSERSGNRPKWAASGVTAKTFADGVDVRALDRIAEGGADK